MLVLSLSTILIFNSFTSKTATETNSDAISVTIDGDWVYIDLKNDCSSEVKYTVKSSSGGSLTGGSVAANNKKRHTAKTDSKFYVNGNLVGTASEDQDRKTWVICK